MVRKSTRNGAGEPDKAQDGKRPQQEKPRGRVTGARGWWATLREYARAIGTAVLIALLVRQFGFQAFRIPSGSMRNTLLEGDFLFVNKFLLGAKTPKRIRLFGLDIASKLPYITLPAVRDPRQGDILVFEWPEDPTQDYIKRCVAVAGDLVEVRDGVLRVNGEIYESNFGSRAGDHSCIPDPPDADRCPKPRSLRLRGPRRLASGRIDPTIQFGLREALQIARSRDHLPHLRRQFALVAAAALDRGLFADPELVRPSIETLLAAVENDRELPFAERRRHEEIVLADLAGSDAPYIVPPGHIFMMGDNRFNSLDSRVWGALDTKLIRGKALFIYFSWDPEAKVPRFNRFGDVIR
jgi:signal peptidase I